MKKEYNVLTVGMDKYGIVGMLVDVDKVVTIEDWGGCFDPEFQHLDNRVIQHGIYLGNLTGRLYVFDRESKKIFYVPAENNDVNHAVWCEADEIPTEISEIANILAAFSDTLTYNDVACAILQ